MNGGEGETSYANNSTTQSLVQERMRPLVEAAVAELCRAGVPGRVAVADLGCSSGPNALALVSAAADELRRRCLLDPAAGGCEELSVYLNDLPGNDFNTVFKGVPGSFPQEQQRQRDDKARPLVFVFGTPGSFYGRLFPAGTLHLACSSFSLHWLSKVPGELWSLKLVNKNNICAGRTSPPAVVSAYARQFRDDFSLFLELRAEEILPGGWMVISLKGRSSKDFAATEDRRWWDEMAGILNDMASRGMIDAEKVESFQLPVYEPCLEEMREAIQAEGSFEVVRLERHEIVNSGGTAAAVARRMRATHEAIMARHFGGAGVMDDFVRTAEGYLERSTSSGGLSPRVAVHVAALRKRC